MSEEPLHIFITDPHSRGGGQVTYLTRLASALTLLGHHVTLGCRRGSVLAEAAAQAGCDSLDELHFARGLRAAAWLADLRRLRRYFREEAPHIIHVNGSQDHWACAMANRGPGGTICLLRTRHNTYPVKNSAFNRLLNRRWTDYQIVVCDVVRQDLSRQAPFRQERMCTIHNGVEAEHFRPNAAARGELREEFGYAPQHIVCGLAGRLVEAKGHRFLLKAVARLHPDYPHLRLLFLGEGMLEKPLRILARELGIADILHFAGFRQDMHRCVQAIDIGIQPSIDCDTSSFSLKELMAAEKPVIASDYGGLKEIVRDGVEGLIVAAGDNLSLGAALHRLLDAPELCRTLGAAGRRRVLGNFTVEVFARRTVEAYRRAIALHGGEGAAT